MGGGKGGGESEATAGQGGCSGGPLAWMINRSLGVQAKLQVFFAFVANIVITHPRRCKWGVFVWMNIVFPGLLLGDFELRNEEVLLPQDARELDAMNDIRDVFGHDWGNARVILTAENGGNMLTEPMIRALAQTEATILGLTVEDPDQAGTFYDFSDACEPLFPAYPDGTSGPCFYTSFFSPMGVWNQPNISTGKYVDTTTALQNMLGRAQALESANPTATVSGLSMAATEFYDNAKSNMFMSGVLGQVTLGAPMTLNKTDGTTWNNVRPVISFTHVFLSTVIKGVDRETLTFSVWDLVTFDLPSLTPPERWEKKVLQWAEDNPTANGLKTFRAATQSTANEMLMMILWSIPLVMITLNAMFGYVIWVFLRKPFKTFFKPRLKLALAGVMGVQIAAMTGIFFATMVQVPLTFASQFVMFLVMGIGLDGVFLMVDTFDHAPADLTLEDRMRWTITHAGPSIVIASCTDIAAFLTAAFTPIPAITYFCLTVAFALMIALVLLHTWFCAWMYTIEKNRMAAAEEAGNLDLAKVNAGAMMEPTPLAQFFDGVGKAITKPWVKAVVILWALTLFGFSPWGISNVTPDYGPRDFVKGCGVFCDPSYLLDFVEEHEDNFVSPPLPTTIMLKNFDINNDYASLQILLGQLSATDPSSATALQGHEHFCPSGCMDISNGMTPFSWLDVFCSPLGTAYRGSQACGTGSTINASQVGNFLNAQPMFARDVKLPADLSSTVLPAWRLYYPMRNYDTTEESMDALEATNEIADKSPLSVTIFGSFFTVFSMFVRIQKLLYASLGLALGVAFAIMLLSVHIGVALLIAIIVCMVDANLMAAIWYFDNNMAPFTFAAVVISVGLSLDYAIHVAQEFMIADGTANERAHEAVKRVGRAVFNGGFTTFLGMAILAMGPGKAFYGFAFLFCYMVFLGLSHGLLVLPVVLSIVAPSSISKILKAPVADASVAKANP